MSRTIFLATVAVAAILMELFADQVGVIKWALILLGGVYLVVRALKTYPALYREKKRKAAQLAADEQEYREFEKMLEAVRAKYRPNHLPDDSIELPAAYHEELTALNEKHRDMLTRKFGAY